MAKIEPLNIAEVNWNILVIMANDIQIIRIRPTRIIELQLVILKTTFSPLVDIHQALLQLIFLISVQMNGRQKLHFLTAHHREFIFHYISGHTVSAYIVMELSVANHQYWLLEESVMIFLLLQLLNIPLINGDLLETFKI